MQQTMNQIDSIIRNAIETTHSIINKNGSIIEHAPDIFDSNKPTSSKTNNNNNSEQSTKALFEIVSSTLYENAMPLLNAAKLDIDVAENKMNAVKNTFDTIGEKMQADYIDMQNAITTSYKKMQNDTFTSEKEALDYKKETFHNIKNEYKEVCRTVRRHIPLQPTKASNILYIIKMIFIGICEIPLNIIIFQRFGESDMTTTIMAGTLAIAVPVLAHFIGVFWKQRSEIKEYFWWAISLTLLFLVVNGGIGVFRANVLIGMLAEITETGINSNDIILNIVIFVGITTILFLIAVVSSYKRVDFSHSLEHAHAQYIKHKKEYETANKAFNDKQNKLDLEIKDRIEELPELYKDKLKSLFDLDDHYIDDHREAIADYERALEMSRGLEKLIQAEYSYAASSIGLKVTELPTHFNDLYEVVVQNYKTKDND